MTDRVFVDSNIWVYLFAHENSEKSQTSKQFIFENSADKIFVISYQVINEVSNVQTIEGVSIKNIF